MKITPIAVNRIIIETETSQSVDINDAGRYGLIIRAADFENKMPIIELDDTRVTIIFKDRPKRVTEWDHMRKLLSH